MCLQCAIILFMQSVYILQIHKLSPPQEPQKVSKTSNLEPNDRLPTCSAKGELAQGQMKHLDA